MKSNRGFSLVEIIIVIAIMAILIAIIAPNLTKYLGKSKEKTDLKNADEIAVQLHNCITDYETEQGVLIANPDDVLLVDWDPNKLYFTTPVNVNFDKIINEVVTAHTDSKETGGYAKATITRNSDSVDAGYTIVVMLGNASVTK